MQIRNKNSITIGPNANLIAMENIAVHVHQGNKGLNGKMHLQKFFFLNVITISISRIKSHLVTV